MLTNKTELPLSIALWLADDDYDHSNNPNTISATTILKPLKSTILSIRSDTATGQRDIADFIPSRTGTAIHSAIEMAWLSKRVRNNLLSLGYPEKIADSIQINPENLDPKRPVVWMEQRSFKEIEGFTISGKFDFVADGVLEDFKTTGTYNWISQSNKDSYIKQGSIYRWLNPEIITADHMHIRYIFTDWSRMKALTDSSYPQNRIMTGTYELMSLPATEAMVKEKVIMLKQYIDSPEEEIPPCTKEELWQRDAVFKYYKKPGAARATKNFPTYMEAHQRYTEDGSVGQIIEVKGEVKRCLYCNGLPICQQAKGYIEDGLLVV